MMPEKTKIIDPDLPVRLSDRTRMNDHNLDQRTKATMQELQAELQESCLRLDLQITTMETRLKDLKDRKEQQEKILDGMEGLRI